MQQNLIPEQAYTKIKYFCSYRERSHWEVREKLFQLRLPKKEAEALLARLIEEDYLNEERFAIQFAGGHFRQKKWGRLKIVFALRQKKVSEANIKKALKEMAGEDYSGSLQQLALKRWVSLCKESPLSRQAKTMAYLVQKGYERPLVQAEINRLKSGLKD